MDVLRHSARPLLWGMSVLALLIALALSITDVVQQQHATQVAFASARLQAAQASTTIEHEFGHVMTLAQRVADDLSQGTLPYSAIDDRLRNELQAQPEVDGVAVTFAPYIYQPTLRLYQVYLSKDAAGEPTLQHGATYDYTAPPSATVKTAWYHTPLTQGPTWDEPFLATGARQILIEYGVPFFRGQGAARVPAGVVTLDYTLHGLRTVMNALQLGATGYGIVLSASGSVLAHPDQQLVAQSSLFDPTNPLRTPTLVTATQQALQGHASTTEAIDSVTGQNSWLFFRPLPATHWALGIVLNQAELVPNRTQQLRMIVTIILVLALALLSALANVLRVTDGRIRHYWRFAIAFSLIAVAVMGLVWTLASAFAGGNTLPVTNTASAQRTLTVYTQHLPPAEVPIVIPTGMQLTAISFPTATSVLVNGFVWQRYDDTVPATVLQGVAFTQQAANQTLLTEVQRVHADHATTIVWSFGIQLAQNFDPIEFPFDQRTIQIRLVPLELNQNVVLIPDFGAYTFMKPSLLPGINADVVITNWQFRSSYFSYHLTNYQSDLGLPVRFERTNNPVLFFTIQTQRTFIGPFIAYLLPAVVAAGLLFAFLASNHRPDEPKELITTLSYIAALFFVIAVSHTALRDNVAAVGITYLEYVYLLLYVAILAVALNSFLLAKRPQIRLVYVGNNALPKLLYWPCFTGLLMITTLFTFVFR